MNVIKKMALSLVVIDGDGLKEATRIGTHAKKLAKDIKEKEKEILPAPRQPSSNLWKAVP